MKHLTNHINTSTLVIEPDDSNFQHNLLLFTPSKELFTHLYVLYIYAFIEGLIN